MSTTQQIPLTLDNVILKGCTSREWMSIGPVVVTGCLDRIAAEIEKAYLLIPRADLPTTKIINEGGPDLIEVAGADSLWRAADNPDSHRRWALEYLAAAESITAHQASAKAAEAEDARRLDADADAFRGVINPGFATAMDWSELEEETKNHYRKIARKARELHKAPQ